MLDTNVIKTIRVPKPIKPLDTNLFDYCPRCGVNSVRPATYKLEPIPPTYLQPIVHGFKCASCGIFYTSTHEGIAYQEVGE